MNERTKRRIALNETVFREINEQIEGLNRNFLTAGSDEDMPILCECGEMACADGLVVSVADYERIRANPLLFFVIPGHEIPAVEDVVERTKAYLVVRKRPEGVGGQIAAENDPRSR